MEALTATEARIMQVIWDLGPCLVRAIIDKLPPPEPKYTTVSSVVRILEKKGFVGHKAYGRTYEYFPLITKAEYRKSQFRDLIQDYFDGSYRHAVSFMVQEESLSKNDLKDLLDMIDAEDDSAPN